MITLKADATIDIDENRRIWIEATAEVDPETVNVTEIIGGLVESVTTQSLAAHDQIVPRYAPVAPDPTADRDAQRLAGNGKEADPMGTFGDD